LAKDLQAEFPWKKGFSASNLWRMKLFHETFVDNEKLAPLVREIGVTQTILTQTGFCNTVSTIRKQRTVKNALAEEQTWKILLNMVVSFAVLTLPTAETR
jgi:hypothetical protein